MKAKLWLLFASLLFTLSFMGLVSAQTGQIYLKEDFNYASLDQMQAAGWAFTRPAGISVTSSAVTLDGTGGDCAISRSTSFSDDGLNWKVEVKAMWLGQGHSVLSVFVGTAEHSYGWAADGYYKEFSFYRDSQKILHFGNYAEKAGEYVTLTMIREGNTFSFFFNGNLINTYTEQDTTPSKVTSLGLVSPWRGDAKYDYYQIGEPNAVVVPSNPSEVTSSFPLVPVLIGGGITTAVVGGILVYYFFVAGHNAGSTAGAGAGSIGGTAPDPDVLQPTFNAPSVIGQNVSVQGTASGESSAGSSVVAGAQAGALEGTNTPSNALAQVGVVLQSTQSPLFGGGQGIEATGMGIPGSGQNQTGMTPQGALSLAGAALHSTGNNLFEAGQGIQVTGMGVQGPATAQGAASVGSSVGASGVAGAQAGALEGTPSALSQAGAALQASGQNTPYGAGQGIQETGMGATGAQSSIQAGVALQSTGNNLYGAGQGIQETGVGVAGAQSQVQPQNSSTKETCTIKPKTEEKPTN